MLGVVLLGGLVWVVVAATRPATKKDETVTPKPTPVVPKPVDSKPKVIHPDDRKAATTFREHRATLIVLPEGEPLLTVKPDDPLPAGKFALIEVNFVGVEKVHANYAADTLLPNVAGLKSLARIRIQTRLDLSADQVTAMTAMPLFATLERLETATELTPKSLAELKKFKSLRDLTCRIPAADDALFVQLGDFQNLMFLTVLDLRQSDDVTEKGWRAVAKLPLVKLFFYDSRISAAAFRALTAKGAQRALMIAGGTFDAEALLELSTRPSDLSDWFWLDLRR